MQLNWKSMYYISHFWFLLFFYIYWTYFSNSLIKKILKGKFNWLSFFQVLIKEIGSEEEVSKAILSEDFSSEKSSQIKSRGSCWQGRAAKISNLETQLENLKNHVANSQANNSSSTAGSSSESSSSSPKYHPNNRRGIGDGSSRQGTVI